MSGIMHDQPAAIDGAQQSGFDARSCRMRDAVIDLFRAVVNRHIGGDHRIRVRGILPAVIRVISHKGQGFVPADRFSGLIINDFLHNCRGFGCSSYRQPPNMQVGQDVGTTDHGVAVIRRDFTLEWIHIRKKRWDEVGLVGSVIIEIVKMPIAK